MTLDLLGREWLWHTRDKLTLCAASCCCITQGSHWEQLFVTRNWSPVPEFLICYAWMETSKELPLHVHPSLSQHKQNLEQSNIIMSPFFSMQKFAFSKENYHYYFEIRKSFSVLSSWSWIAWLICHVWQSIFSEVYNNICLLQTPLKSLRALIESWSLFSSPWLWVFKGLTSSRRQWTWRHYEVTQYRVAQLLLWD